ncbi:hypothetical protein HZ326_1789 [Fusarium oxysporum f. sp. albedinis]|nr:hypothetical protein HZ326_1789 [Fusarium oxysporum f. sp. albedinis]
MSSLLPTLAMSTFRYGRKRQLIVLSSHEIRFNAVLDCLGSTKPMRLKPTLVQNMPTYRCLRLTTPQFCQALQLSPALPSDIQNRNACRDIQTGSYLNTN